MAHSLGQVYVHLVFSTKECIPFLVAGALRSDLHGYMTGILRNLGCPSLRVGGVADHVHVLFRLSRVQAIGQVEQEVKRGSSAWLRARGVEAFEWQEGYGAFSVSPQNLDGVIRYVENQEDLHRDLLFADEYGGFLDKCDGLEHEVDIHLVFSTKNRTPFLIGSTVRRHLHARITEICETMDCPALQVGGFEDHVHILYRLSPEQQLARVAQEVKKSSSRWLSMRHRIMHFDWQEGYGAFSVSPQHVPAVIRYIKNQHEHHQHETFAEENSRMANIRLRPQSPGPPGIGKSPSPPGVRWELTPGSGVRIAVPCTSIGRRATRRIGHVPG